ncbi:MAG: hypothetical protein R2854_28415 [Caldilineaceae bacterium]
MVLHELQTLDANATPLQMETLPDPTPGPDEVLLQVTVCCGVCHTEMDEIEGRTPPPSTGGAPATRWSARHRLR